MLRRTQINFVFVLFSFAFNLNTPGGWKGPCIYLKSTDGFAPRQFECDRELSFMCKWSGEQILSLTAAIWKLTCGFFSGINCPSGYSSLGHISDGISCYSVLPDEVELTPTMCDVPDIDELRHPVSPHSAYFTEAIIGEMT